MNNNHDSPNPIPMIPGHSEVVSYKLSIYIYIYVCVYASPKMEGYIIIYSYTVIFSPQFPNPFPTHLCFAARSAARVRAPARAPERLAPAEASLGRFR